MLAALVVTLGCVAPSSRSAAQPTARAAALAPIPPRPLARPVVVLVNCPSQLEAFSNFFMALEMGEFAKENIIIKRISMSSPDAQLMLVQGKIDVVLSGVTGSVVNAQETGLVLKVVAPTYSGRSGKEGLWVANRLQAGGIESLRGKKIGSATGPSASTVLAIADHLAKGGLDISDVKIVKFPLADIHMAMKNGAVAAAWFSSPEWMKIEKGGDATFVSGYERSFTGSSIQFGPSLLKRNRAVGEAFIRALARTHRLHLQGDYKSDPATLARLSKALQQPQSVLRKTPSLKWSSDLDMRAWGPDMERLQNIWIEQGGILVVSTPIPASRFIDTSFVDAVIPRTSKQGS